MGVVRRCILDRYPQNNYYIFPTPLVLALFLVVASLLLCSFFYSCLLFLCNIANVAQRTFEIIQKSGSREYN